MSGSLFSVTGAAWLLPSTRGLRFQGLMPKEAAIPQLYTDGQTARLVDTGGNLSGPGRLSIITHNMDLAISDGIKVNSENPFLPAQVPFSRRRHLRRPRW